MRGGEYRSKITKSIQDKETFTRTECTSTVIYKYSSPSSFQLSENKSKYKEQLKDPLTQPFWRAETIKHNHMVTVLHSSLYLQDCTYIHTGAICSLRFILQRSKTRFRLLTWSLTMGDTPMHTFSQIHTLWGCSSAYILIFVHAYVKHTYILTHRHTHTHFNTILSSDNWHKGSPGELLGHVCFTSLHLPLCNNQVLKYHQTNQGQETSAAFPGQRHATESPDPSSLSSSYASPPPDLLGTEWIKRERENRAKKKMKRWVKEQRCKSRKVSEGVQSGQ